MSNNYLDSVKPGKLKLKGNKSLYFYKYLKNFIKQFRFKSKKTKSKQIISAKIEIDEDQLERGFYIFAFFFNLNYRRLATYFK